VKKNYNIAYPRRTLEYLTNCSSGTFFNFDKRHKRLEFAEGILVLQEGYQHIIFLASRSGLDQYSGIHKNDPILRLPAKYCFPREISTCASQEFFSQGIKFVDRHDCRHGGFELSLCIKFLEFLQVFIQSLLCQGGVVAPNPGVLKCLRCI